MAEGLNSSTNRKQENAPAEHLGVFPAYRVPRTNFDVALHDLTAVPYRLSRDGRRAAMLTALDNLATWGQIKHWRAGRRAVPKWARDLLARKIAARRAELDRGYSTLQRSA